MYTLRKKVYLFCLITTITFSLCGCNQDKLSSNQQAELQNTSISEYNSSETNFPNNHTSNHPSSTETLSSNAPFRFVDALGEWHETTILSNVKKHNYNWNYLTNDGNTITYSDTSEYTIRKGVDVSYHQGNIDWEKVKAEGYDFAIIRIAYRGYGTSGVLKVDTKFHENIKGAQNAGLDVGVYFFAQAINETEAIEEANLVLETLKGYELQLPVVYDPELIRDDTARTDNVSGEQFTKNTIVFCNMIKEAGFQPMIYSNMIWEAFLFDMTQLQEYPIWYADYEAIPQTPYDFTMWQYSEKGTVDGINGPVDLNIWFCPTKS